MSDHTRTCGDPAPGDQPNRTSSDDWPEQTWPANLGDQIDSLRRSGCEVLALTMPWAESVRAMLWHFEAVLAPLQLDDELHRQVGEAAGIADLYDMFDKLSAATSEFG